MTSSRNGVAVWVAAALSLAACSDDKTIVSLNVTFTNVSSASTLEVGFKQSGENAFTKELEPPTVENEAEDGTVTVSLRSPFFERITMPDSWSSGTATITVDALDEDSKPVVDPISGEEITAKTEVEIEEMETVAAYVTLAGEPPPPAVAAGGAGGAGAAGSAGAAAGSAGAAGAPTAGAAGS